jgi:(p)ppGpp synthase/HD superfamily hydrolase
MGASLPMSDHKLFVALRYWLLGAGFHQGLKALEFGASQHTGLRKDGITPEFEHQLRIALFLKTLLKDLEYPEETLAASLLHDTPEDKDVGFEEINSKFGSRISNAVVLLTKKYRGDKTPPEVYYKNLSKDPIASVVKGADRINNIQSMVGVFTLEKQKQYIEETKTLVLPMLKEARRTFTRQEAVYENIKFVLKSQLELIVAMHAAKGFEQ